jgi:signal peptidase I
MAPVLEPGDQALVEKISGAPHRGDLVAFHRPRTGEVLLKRVVAVGGDTVGLEDGILVVNRHPVHEPYANTKSQDGVYFGPSGFRAGRSSSWATTAASRRTRATSARFRPVR